MRIFRGSVGHPTSTLGLGRLSRFTDTHCGMWAVW